MFEQCVRGSRIVVASAQLNDREVDFLLGRVAHQLLGRRSGANDELDAKPFLVFERNQRREPLRASVSIASWSSGSRSALISAVQPAESGSSTV